MQTQQSKTVKDILWAIVFAGIVAALLRFILGLGVTTGLNDASPWGLWIAFKLGFVALAGGGFTLAAIVYIFHLESYRPILRRAILLALLGYGSFIVSLLFDLGLPWHIYMPLINWQHHSVMFEIAWCVMLYFSVLVMEFGPVILEHRWFQHPVFQTIAHLLHKATLPLVIAGIILSTLHQSSLGALFLIMPHRVHPLWYSPLIPVLFFASAIAVGLVALVLENHLASYLFKRKIDYSLLVRMSKNASFVLWIYLAIRVGDLVYRGVLPQALDGSWQSMLFLAEILVGGVLPAALLLAPKIRQSSLGMITCGILIVFGILSQRMSLSLFAMQRPETAPYWPSGLEILIAFAIPAAAGLIYFLFSENLAVFDPVAFQKESDLKRDLYAKPVFNRQTLVLQEDSLKANFGRRSLLAVILVALTVATLPASITKGETIQPTPAQAATGWDVLLISSNPGYHRYPLVAFPHTEHQQHLQSLVNSDEEYAVCRVCHHLSKPGDGPTSCWECHQDVYQETNIFNHTYHQQTLGQNDSCVECHQGEHSASTAKNCSECHESMVALPGRPAFSPLAPGYQQAMHGKCLTCHQEQAIQLKRPELELCSTCHQSTDLSNDEQVLDTRLNGN